MKVVSSTTAGVSQSSVLGVSTDPQKVIEAYNTLIDHAKKQRAERSVTPDRGEVEKRQARFAWKPTAADLKEVETRTAAAQNLAPNEEMTTEVWFSTPCQDIRTAPTTEMYAKLIEQVKNAKHSIRAALYGMDTVPELVEELRAAIKRGVDVKIVVDQNADGTFQYKETEKLLAELGPNIMRVECNDFAAIMHNKFWVFDDARVWTGSANINDSAIRRGYNNEISVLFGSKNLAKIFNAEHAQMWAGKFHTAKTSITPIHLPKTKDGVEISCFFSPQHDALKDGIIPAIDKAKKSIKLSLFHMADQDVALALLRAKKRGVDVEMILDSTGGENEFTKRNILRLRDAGVKIKVECWGGKQHMKGGCIDGLVSIIGSLNWTGSGVKKNDENCLVIRGDKTLGQKVDEDFSSKFGSLPKYTLHAFPDAESLLSIGSTTDGSDNDHDGVQRDLLTRFDYLQAVDHIKMATTRIKSLEGAAVAAETFREAMEYIRREVVRVRAWYESDSRVEYFAREMKEVEDDIPKILERAELAAKLELVTERINKEPVVDELWREQAVIEKKISQIKLLRPLGEVENLVAKLEKFKAREAGFGTTSAESAE